MNSINLLNLVGSSQRGLQLLHSVLQSVQLLGVTVSLLHVNVGGGDIVGILDGHLRLGSSAFVGHLELVTGCGGADVVLLGLLLVLLLQKVSMNKLSFLQLGFLSLESLLVGTTRSLVRLGDSGLTVSKVRVVKDSPFLLVRLQDVDGHGSLHLLGVLVLQSRVKLVAVLL